MNTTPLFELGSIVATRGALDVLRPLPVDVTYDLLRRHSSGDWGEVPDEDKALNDEAVRLGNRLLSAYTIEGTRLWVITEADRSTTTILLPDEY